MVTRLASFVLLVAHFSAHAAEPVPTADQIRSHAGDAIGTAKLTHFDYRHHLDGALRKQTDSLHRLFLFTMSESFIGAGADDHCGILHDLLQFWGDHSFAVALRRESAPTRKAVIAALDYSWRYPGWQRSEYPQTYRLARHEKISTSPP